MSYPYYCPPGWAPPYQGAPPPMPSNLSVNQQQWQRGTWQFNPAYKWQRYTAPQMQWMAASAWNYAAHYPRQPHAANAANYNPYKKVIKPPSAEYLAMKVSNNGLDLHNMVKARDPDDDAEKPPETPWIWNPATLTHDAPAGSTRTAVPAAAADNDRAQNRSSSESQLHRSTSVPATRPRHATDPLPSSSYPLQANASTSSDHNGTSSLKPTFSSKIIRTPAHYTQSSNAPASVDSLASRMQNLTTSGPTSLGRQSSMPSIHSDSRQSSSISGTQLSDEPMSILSPLVIPMTPKVSASAKRPVTRGATHPNIGNQSGLDTIREGPVVQVITPSGSSSRPREGRAQTYVPASQQSSTRPMASRSESHPRPSFFRVAPPQDRPISRTQDSHRPSIVQQHTPPDIDSSIPRHEPPPDLDSYIGRRESPPDFNLYILPRQPSPRPSTPRRPIEIYAPTPPPPQRNASSDHIPTGNPSSHQSSPTPTRDSPSGPSGTSPPTSYPITPASLRRNSAPASPYVYYDEERPKPVKPVRIYTPISLPPVQRRRLGYWNRRGDHCTVEGYIVFAPPELAFPTELSTYPERDYQDDLGFRVAFDSKRPELPESLPRHGQPPEKPYKDFLTYTD